MVAALKAEYTVSKGPINIMSSHTELEILPSLTFSIPKYSLWIHKVLSHICIFSVLQIGGLVTYRVLKRNNLRESKSGNLTNMKYNVENFTQFDVKMILIWTFPANPSIEQVPNLAKREAYQR